jgi:tetratricopeptide (TPR) repeat protein
LTLAPGTPRQGERVIVFGNPLGLEGSVSDGIVSAIREIPAFGKIFQTTAAISPGSSGSPVLNMNGQVVGVATFYLSGGQNLNFAIPSQRIARMHSQKVTNLDAWFSSDSPAELQKARSLYFLGLTKLYREGCSVAMDYFLQAGRLNPGDWRVQTLIGACAYDMGHYQESLAAAREAVRQRPESGEVHWLLAQLAMRLGHHQEALDESKQAVRLNPDFAPAYNSLGRANMSLGHNDEALELLRQAIRLDPDDTYSYVLIGIIYRKLGQLQEALGALKQAVKIKPDLV